MRRRNRKRTPISDEPVRCVVLLSSDEEHNEYEAEKEENKQLKRINKFAKDNNLVPMKIIRRGIMGISVMNQFFNRAIAYMKAGKADAIVAVNLEAISSGTWDAYSKVGKVREKGFRIITVDEKEQYLYLYEPPKKRRQQDEQRDK